MYGAGIAHTHAMASHAQGSACEDGTETVASWCRCLLGWRRDFRRKQASTGQGFSASRHHLNHISSDSNLLCHIVSTLSVPAEFARLLAAADRESNDAICGNAMVLDHNTTCCSTTPIMPNCPHDAPLTPIIGSCAQRRLGDPIIPTLLLS